jgi:two-component system, OmpR family, sensor kinase
MIRTFRFRLTAWYLALFALLFAGFSLFLYGLVAHALEARLDEMLVSEANTAAALVADEMDESKGNAPESAREVVSEMVLRPGTVAIYSGGHLLASSGPLPHNHELRTARRSLTTLGHSFDITAMEPMDAIAADLRIVRQVMFFGLPLFLGLAGVGGYWMVRRNLAPLESMARQAHRMGGANLHARLEVGAAAEELALLAAAFNELLGRLDQSFESMRRFVADASHELRTPLAIIRGEADVALAQERSPAEYRESLAVILDESRRLSRLVEDLLNLARADSGRVTLQVHDFYFNELLADCCRSLHSLATRRGVTLECRTEGDVPFAGDEELLRRLAINLLDNAVRYTPAGGKVTAEVREWGQNGSSGVSLRISDTGIGIAPEARPHVFERFFRADKARSRSEGGFGLGLSIVKWIAESHRGAVELEPGPATGSTFTVRLPK